MFETALLNTYDCSFRKILVLFYYKAIPVPNFVGSQQIDVKGFIGSITFIDPPKFLKTTSKISYIFFVFPKCECSWYKVSQSFEQHGFVQLMD